MKSKSFEDRLDAILWRIAVFLIATLVVVNVGRYILERAGILEIPTW